MVKKILLSLASVFLLVQSCSLLINISKFESGSWGVEMFVAWIISLLVTGTFAFVGFAFPTQKLLPNSYYIIRNPEFLSKAYRILGVNLFRKILLVTIWKNKGQRKKYFDGKRNGILNLAEQSMKSEFGHLIPFIIINLVSIYLVLIGGVRLGALTLLINLIGNLYPIILQRHHRMRIQNIRRRSTKAHSSV